MFFNKNSNSIRLQAGANIAIIGGGPAGCFFALHALNLSRSQNLNLNITIFDGKNFLLTGPPGCNLCAGVISERLVNLLRDHGIVLDSPKVQRKIKGYFLQTPLLGVPLHHPQWMEAIYSVFRGNGPRSSQPADNISFDDLLLQHVIQQGVQHISEPVTEIILPQQQNENAQLLTRVKNQTKNYSVDLIVGAFGLNSSLLTKITHLGFSYRPPQTIATFQAELPLPNDWIQQRFRDHIVVFSYRSKRTQYVVAVPKTGYLSISVINHGDAEHSDFDRFVNSSLFRSYLPQGDWKNHSFCFCKPRIAISSAKHPFTNHFVLIGDAGYSRIYKNGIESAYFSAFHAAQTAIRYGVSRRQFWRHYHLPMLWRFVIDNFFGHIMFFIYSSISKIDSFARVLLQTLAQPLTNRGNRSLRNIIWNMFTGQERYARIFLQFISPRFQLFMMGKTLESIWQKFPDGRQPLLPVTDSMDRVQVKAAAEGLPDGSVIGIIGGGPGGVACALTIQAIARTKGIRVRTVLYEGKTYSGMPHYNQCVGVLSPPIRTLLEDQLNVRFPDHLVQRQITGYILHSDHNRVTLRDESDCSYAVRRITFDDYLLAQAIARGVEVRHSRLTDLELHPERVILYSETDFLRADVVIGAFGLDDGSIQIFERATDYRAPDFLYSIVTKIHPDEKYMERIGNNIFAFLPSYHPIEFGAITPKQNHITINIAGRNVDAHCMDTFLRYPPVRRILPTNDHLNKDSLQYFKGKFPISVAKNYYGQRYVLIGDAAGMVRPFKGKGINSAIQTGIAAARVIIHEGVSAQALHRYEEACAEIIQDLPYGHFMRHITILSANYGLLDFLLYFARENQQMRRALFDSVSAHRYYREILRETIQPQVLKAAVRSFIRYQSTRLHGVRFATR